MTEYIYERQVYTPEGFDKEPETVLEALQQARAVLVEEGRWMQGQWFQNLHPEADPEDAFCNNWRVCAEGAVAIVTTGLVRCRVKREDEEYAINHWSYDMDHLAKVKGLDTAATLGLYDEAREVLKRAGEEVFLFRSAEAWKYNDCFIPTDEALNRTKILRWFDKAIELAEQEKVNA